ncbi:MAG: sulfur reduction protein DsrS [Gammaproteobacteria bacterium]|nr:sulfur reduction protein DsrS [Gammaproteobacteria bacterium]
MDLSSEDSLRLNVLIANSIAVRINEGAMSVHGLSEAGKEARVQLYPTCGADRYIRYVRELLSSTILGSPGGYPVFLKRWTRMGQAKDTRLADLLMLGEPEAVVAVSCATGLTDELARCVWWIMPDAENARRMLLSESVVKGEMGKVLANFLLEFLPFEQEPGAIIESVRLVLQPDLLDESSYMSIWNRGKQKSVFLVGFLQALPDDLPEPLSERSDFAQYRTPLGDLAKSNPFALQLLGLLSTEGQTFIHVCKRVLTKPNNQDVVVELLEAITRYLSNVRISPLDYEDVESIISDVHDIGTNKKNEETPMQQQLSELLQAVPELKKEINAMLVLAHAGERVVRPIFSRTDAVGSVMRRKLEPVSKLMMEQFSVLNS